MKLRAVRPGEAPALPLPTPDQIDALPLDALPGTIAALAALQARAAMRLVQPPTTPLDRLLDLETAAARLATTVDWLQRQRDAPFRVEVSPGQVRFSEQAIEAWIAARRGPDRG
jgi:hypothetical protein